MYTDIIIIIIIPYCIDPIVEIVVGLLLDSTWCCHYVARLQWDSNGKIEDTNVLQRLM